MPSKKPDRVRLFDGATFTLPCGDTCSAKVFKDLACRRCPRKTKCPLPEAPLPKPAESKQPAPPKRPQTNLATERHRRNVPNVSRLQREVLDEAGKVLGEFIVAPLREATLPNMAEQAEEEQLHRNNRGLTHRFYRGK